MLVGQQGQVLTARSFELGAVRLTNRFFAGERLHLSACHRVRTYVRSTLPPYGREVAAHGFEVAVGFVGDDPGGCRRSPRRRRAPSHPARSTASASRATRSGHVTEAPRRAP